MFKQVLKVLDFLAEFDSDQIRELRLAQRDGLDITRYCDPKFSWEQIEELTLAQKDGCDITAYCDPSFDWEQIRELRIAQKDGLDITSMIKNFIKLNKKYE